MLASRTQVGPYPHSLQVEFPQSVNKTVLLEARVSTWSCTSTVWCYRNTVQTKSVTDR